ncbi:MAG: hypothetical protein KJ069_23120 [Anaerolineae bacterium]|nr:hypothetical protein [Anaerolineae bacterium]
MLAVVILVSLVSIALILFWPRRSKYVRRVTKSYNGQRYGKERELY